MQPDPDYLGNFWQKCNSLFPAGPFVDSTCPTQQQRLQLQQFFEQFRAHLNKDDGCHLSRPVDFNLPAMPSTDNLGTELESRLRIKRNLTTPTDMNGWNVFSSPTANNEQSKPDAIISNPILSPFYPLKQLSPILWPILIGSGKPDMMSEKSILPAISGPNIFANLTHLHQLALNIFAQNNVDSPNAMPRQYNVSTNPPFKKEFSSLFLDQAQRNSSTELSFMNMFGIPQLSTDLGLIKSDSDVLALNSNAGISATMEGAINSIERTGCATSLNNHYAPKTFDYLKPVSNNSQNMSAYPALNREPIHHAMHPHSFLSNPDPWVTHMAKPVHNITSSFQSHKRKNISKQQSEHFQTNNGPCELTSDGERPRLVRLSNNSVKPIHQLTVSDFVSSALHLTSNNQTSPVAATLTEALLHQCGLELCWVKLAHMRERVGLDSVVRLLFNVSSKRHRLPIGACERIQGRHSSRMLWPQFSAKSFKMHKKLCLDAAKDQPFFVHTFGWSSIDPCLTWKHWGLVCRQLTVDDICLVMIQQSVIMKKHRLSNAIQSQSGVEDRFGADRLHANVSATMNDGPENTQSTRGLPRPKEPKEDSTSVEDESFRARLEIATTSSVGSASQSSSRITSFTKRKFGESEASRPTQFSNNDEVDVKNKVGPFKRFKTDETSWQSEHSFGKTSFFSARNLAQSNEKIYNGPDVCGEKYT